MNLADTIRASLLHTYGNSNPGDVDEPIRYSAGANAAATALLDQLRGMGALELRQWLDNQIIDDEPEDERRRRHAGHGEDPFAQHDRDRITSLASETAQHEAKLADHGQRFSDLASTLNSYAERSDRIINQLHDGLALAHGVNREHDARLSAVELLTHNVTELARELRTLRDSHLEHIGRGQLGMEPLHPEEHSHAAPYQDDDQRLGGHDQPHPNPPEEG